MKKILKSILFVFIISVAILGAAVFLLPSSNLICSAATSNTTHSVSFYDGNKLLYSLEVEDGQSLQDLSNNNLFVDSAFTNLSVNLPYTVTSSRLINSNVFVFSYTQPTLNYDDNYNLVLSGLGEGRDFVIGYDMSDFMGYDNIQMTFSFYLSSLVGRVQPRVGGSTGQYFDTIIEPGFYSYTFNFSSSDIINNLYYSLLAINFSGDYSFTLDYWQLNVGDEAVSYFDIDYINKLFISNNNLDLSDNIYWSTSQSTGQFDFSQPITEDTIIYGYEELEFNENAQQLEAEMTYQPSYYLLEKAIDNIEYIHYKGSLFFNIYIDTSKLEDNLYFLRYNSNTSFDFINFSNKEAVNYLDGFAFSTFGFDEYTLNLSITSDNNSIKLNSFDNSFGSIVSYGYEFYLLKDTGVVTFSFSLTEFVLKDDVFIYDDYEDFIFYNGTDLNDMNSNTNYFLNIVGFDNFDDEPGELVDYKFDLSKIIQHLETSIAINFNGIEFNDTDKYLILYFRENDNYISYNQYESNIGNAIFYLYFNDVDDDGSSINYGFIPFSAYTIYSGFKFSQFDIVVRKPVARVDNSLVIFNFGYNNFLNAVTQVKYELRRGFNYYDVIYNGTLENSKMIVIDNEYVRNSLFDEYIFVSFLIDGTNTTTFDIKDGKIGCYMGFDFNFVYYTQPLIAGNSSYDLMQYRPEYMDGTPSLVPLNIPFTAWIYNAFLWLIFDCPLISDILGFLHLQSFMGALLNILDLYVNSGIGQFVLACLSFIIFWLILKSLMPSIVGGLKSSISTVYKDYSDNKMEEAALKMNIIRQQMRQKGRYKSFKFNKGRLNYHKNNGISRVHQRNLVKRKFTGTLKSVRPKIKDNKD